MSRRSDRAEAAAAREWERAGQVRARHRTIENRADMRAGAAVERALLALLPGIDGIQSHEVAVGRAVLRIYRGPTGRWRAFWNTGPARGAWSDSLRDAIAQAVSNTGDLAFYSRARRELLAALERSA